MDVTWSMVSQLSIFSQEFSYCTPPDTAKTLRTFFHSLQANLQSIKGLPLWRSWQNPALSVVGSIILHNIHKQSSGEVSVGWIRKRTEQPLFTGLLIRSLAFHPSYSTFGGVRFGEWALRWSWRFKQCVPHSSLPVQLQCIILKEREKDIDPKDFEIQEVDVWQIVCDIHFQRRFTALCAWCHWMW